MRLPCSSVTPLARFPATAGRIRITPDIVHGVETVEQQASNSASRHLPTRVTQVRPMSDDIGVPESAYLDQGPDAEAARYCAVRRLLEAPEPHALARALDLAQNAIEVYRAAPVKLAPQLGALLDHPDTAIRRRAVELLAVSEDGARASTVQLSLLLNDHDTMLADAAACGLALVGDERILPRVISALDKPDEPPPWIGNALSALPQHADLLLPKVSAAIYRHTTACVSEQCHARTFRAMLMGIADWGASSRMLIEEANANVPAECGIFSLVSEMALRSEPEPAHLATVFDCVNGRYYRNRMRLQLRKARGEHGIAAIEARVDHVLATEPGKTARNRSLVVDLAVIAAGGAMRREHEVLLEQFLSTSVFAQHAAYALWLLHGSRAAERACATLSTTVADPYYGPTALGYLAEMGPDAVRALDAIDALLARRRRLTVNDPDWQYELRSDDRLCAAARCARRRISQ